MSYIQYNIGLSDGQKEKLSRAYKNKCPISIKLSHSQLSGNSTVNLTQTQINSIQNAKNKGVGVTINFSKRQLQQQSGGFLGALAPLLARAVVPVATKVAPKVLAPLATGALSGLASTGIGKIIGRGPVSVNNPSDFIQKARPYLTQAQINQLNKKGSFTPTKKQEQDGGFLPLLLGSLAAPLIAPLAGNLIKDIAGKGLQVGRKRKGRGLQIGPPGYTLQTKKKISDFQE